MAATTTLTLGLVLREASTIPTRADPGGDERARHRGRLLPARRRYSRPRRREVADGGVRRRRPQRAVPGDRAELEAPAAPCWRQTQGRDTARAAVDQPEMTEGGWVRDGGVVVEAAFAAALDVSVGDRITLKPLDTAAVGSGARPRARPVVPGRRRRRHRGHRPAIRDTACHRDSLPGRRQLGPGLAHPGRCRGLAPPGGPRVRAEPEAGRPGDRAGVRREAHAVRPTAGRDGSTRPPRPAALAGHPRVERQPGQEPAASADHGLLAARRCSPWPASRCSSAAGWPTRPGASDCSRRSAARPAWSPPCCSPSTSSWPSSRRRPGWRSDR